MQGYARYQIAFANGLSTGTVSAIIQECRSNVSDLDLMRELAVNLRKSGLTILDLAPALRIHNKFSMLGIDVELGELTLENIEVHCFKNHVEPKEFLTIIAKHLKQIENIGIPILEFEEWYNEKTNELLELQAKCQEMRANRDILAEIYKTTVTDLEEFQRLRPIHERWIRAEAEKAQKDRIIDNLNKRIKELESKQNQQEETESSNL